ncbi:MAG: PAS domain S-box protein [Theionarchaea archaeon]|nr:PAS domain S-box protein [Theionarchaea archaeon]MBU7000301.1 PAS domain S-box protein [Theionarchaea archaeon]MBU7020742.1 PAS domain S-box protein [Theionarchaea archaeon]MBU7040126.1 PAS domain S-box protein [Theionarchaea archaeon]
MGKTILVVEPNEKTAAKIGKTLHDLGYACLLSPSGKDALVHARKGSCDAALVDIDLAGSPDGKKIGLTLRTQYAIPTVFLAQSTGLFSEPVLLAPVEKVHLQSVIEGAIHTYGGEGKTDENRQWLFNTLTAMDYAVITTDTTGIVTSLNTMASHLTGWPSRRAVGSHVSDVLHLAGNPDIQPLLHQALSQNSSTRYTSFELQRKEGTSLYLEITAAPLHHNILGITGAVVAFRDVTEEHHTTEALRESEARYTSLFERSLVGVMVHDFEGRLLDANQTILTLLGYAWDEIPSLTLSTLLDQEYLLKAHKIIKEIKETGYQTSPTEFQMKKKNGEQIWVEAEAFLLYRHEAPHAIQSIIRDITERKRSEAQLKSLFEATKRINSTMDMEKRFEYISESIKDLVGADHFIIFFVSQDRSLIYPAFSSPDLKENVEVMALLYNQQVLNQCIDTREGILFHSMDGLPFEGEGALSEILLPLIIEDQCVGAAYLARHESEYTQHDLDILKPLSEVVSAAIWNSRLYEEVQNLNRDLEKRIADRAHRTETILNAKQALQRETSWERGLITIVDSISRLGFDRCGIFMVDPIKRMLKFYYGTGTDASPRDMSLSLMNTEYFGVQCVQEKRTIYVEDAFEEQGKQITSEAASFVWVPIIVRDEAFAAIAADNPRTRRTVSKEDVKDLELFAGMCAAFVDRTRLMAEPVAEDSFSTDLRYNLESGEGYAVLGKKPDKAFEIFVDLVTHEIPGFVMSRTHPDRIRKKYNLVKTPLVWLTRSHVEQGVDPNDLSKLIFIIRNFTRKSQQSVVLLDGLEYLMTQNGFEAALKFLRDLKDTIVLNNSRLIVPLHVDTLSPRELGLLERELILIGG